MTPAQRAIRLAAGWTGSGCEVAHSMIAPSANLRSRALLMLVIATACWGLSFPIIKALALLQARLLPDAGTWFSAVYLVAPRFGLGLLVLLVWQARTLSSVTRGELKQGVIIGL